VITDKEGKILVSGNLDGQGKAKVEGIDIEEYMVKFPDAENLIGEDE
jgi:hypothetical protein